MLTKEQLEKMAKNYGLEVLEIDIPAIKAAKTALAYMKALELACRQLSQTPTSNIEQLREYFLMIAGGGHD